MIKILKKIFDKMPISFAKAFSKVMIKYCNQKDFKLNNGTTDSKKRLLFLDYNNAIGDFIVLIRLVYILDQMNCECDAIIHKKFKGVIENLNLKHINVIYKENDLGNHYVSQRDENDSWKKVVDEFKRKNLEYDEIYYFNKILKIDSLLAISQIKYNKLICTKDIYKYRYKNYRWIQQKDYWLEFYFLIHQDELKIIEIGNKKEDKDLFLADYSYKVIFNELPKQTLSSLTLEKQFNVKPINTKTAIIMLDKERRCKDLKNNVLIEYFNQNFNGWTITFIGTDKESVEYIKGHPNCQFKINDKILKTKTVLDIFEEVKKNNMVIAFDTSILHIAMLLNKKTNLILNKEFYAVKYEHNVWHTYKNSNLDYVIWPEKKFKKWKYKITDEKYPK